ncbi:hypothetical protein CapIbe_016127 [Capra ibex]
MSRGHSSCATRNGPCVPSEKQHYDRGLTHHHPLLQGAELQQNEIYQDAVSDVIQTSSALLRMVLDE